MASVRPIPESYYYSGQGRLGIGERNATTGELYNLIFVGNVTSLTMDIAVQKFEHKESMSGQRAIDLTIIQEKNATFKFTAESLKLDMLATGLYGSKGSVVGAAPVGEVHMARRGYSIPLLHPNVSTVVIATVSGSVPLVEGVDYQVDEGFGTIYILSTSTVVAADPGQTVTIGYTHGAYDKLEAFTQGTPPERFLRFEGLNTVNGDLRLVDVFRASFDPLTGLEFLNEELGQGEFNGNILPDLTITAGGSSQFFRERRIYASALGAAAVVNTAVAPDTGASDNVITLTMSQVLTSANPTGAGGHTLATSGAAMTITAVVVSGATVTLTTSRAILAGETLFLTYTAPGTNKLANANGNVANYAGRAVTNNVV